MHIRRASGHDLSALAQMRWDFLTEGKTVDASRFPEFEARFADFFTRALTSGRWVLWLAEQDGQIVAHVFVQVVEQVPHPLEPDRAFGWITNVYTRPAYRSRGIGSQLMRHVIAWAKAERFESLNLWHSERSVPFYERLGFIHTPDELMLLLGEGG